MCDDDLSIKKMMDMAMGLSMFSLYQQAMTNTHNSLNKNLNHEQMQAPARYIYAIIDGVQQGPFSIGEVMEKMRQGAITPQTYVWKQGMSNWLPAEQVDDLAPAQGSIPPQLP